MTDGIHNIHHGDIIDLFSTPPDKPYHAILCDPPYFLGSISKRFGSKNAAPAKDRDGLFQRHSKGFMGATWDGFESVQHYQAWVTEWATLLLDNGWLYPGAVCMFFGGTRTYHRLVCGLEDAGFEIYDCMMFLYASGFPKAHDVSAAIDKAAGLEREVIGEGSYSDRASDSQVFGQGERGATDERLITAPASQDAHDWQGYKSALKPAYEPVVLCRAPREGHTFAQLATQYGTGSLNIDGCRVGDSEGTTNDRTGSNGDSLGIYGNGLGGGGKIPINKGRFPANVVIDEAAGAMLDAQSGDKPLGGIITKGDGKKKGLFGITSRTGVGYADSGGASRFFYTSKAAGWERTAGLDSRSQHPTMKPIALTEYLARLILPPAAVPDRRLLVPFAGVASEMIGGLLAGWDIVDGIELTDEYIPVAQARLKWWSQFNSYDHAREFAPRDNGNRDDGEYRLSDLPMFADMDNEEL